MTDGASRHEQANSFGVPEQGSHFFIGRQDDPPFVYTLGHATRESKIRFLCHDKLDKEWFERLYFDELKASQVAPNDDTRQAQGATTAPTAMTDEHTIVDLTISDDESHVARLPPSCHAAQKPQKRLRRGHSSGARPPSDIAASRPTPNPRLFPFYIPTAIKAAQRHGNPLSPKKPEAKG